MSGLTIIFCSNIEERWLADLAAQCDAEQDQHERDLDKAERMAGSCDCCQQQPDCGLTIDGGLAVCDGCLHG